MTYNVTNIKPTIADKILELIDESKDIVLIGAGEGDLKVVTTASRGDILLMLEVAKMEIVEGYLEEVLEEG